MQHAETSRLRVVAAAATDAARRDGRDRDDGGEDLVGAAGNDGVPSPGRYIKDQRKRQGMSIDQLAAATKIPRTSLELLESDEHDALPGPVFVKGFLRCCARALGLEPEVVMELVYERERELLVARRRERPSAPVDGADPDAVSNSTAPSETGPEPAQPRAQGVSAGASLASLGRGIGRGGVSVMLWVAVALFVAMVVMAAFNMLGASPIGPT